jgi:hypothetical protein
VKKRRKKERIFNLKNPNDAEVKEQYPVKTSNNFAALATWVMIRRMSLTSARSGHG